MTELPLKKVLAIVGPTASGKSKLALKLAQVLKGEIINADSMQVYKELRVGTARPSKAEQENVPHHLFGHVPVEQEYSVAQYVKEARAIIQEVCERGHLPVAVGGTGLYVRSLLFDVDLTEQPDPAVIVRLDRELGARGVRHLKDLLLAADPEAAQRIDLNNPRRIINALARLERAPRPVDQSSPGEARDIWNAEPLYDHLILGMNVPRPELRDRIKTRTEQMLGEGLIDEVQRVFFGSILPARTAGQAIGYKEYFPFIKGECLLEVAVLRAETATMRYAKRQMTWFRKESDVMWLDAGLSDEDKLFQLALSSVQNWLEH